MQIGTLVKIKEGYENQFDGAWKGLIGIIVEIKRVHPFLADRQRIKIKWNVPADNAWHAPCTLEVLCS